MLNVKVQSADGHEMTVDEALQIIFDYHAIHNIKIVLSGDMGEVWGEVSNDGKTIAEVQAEYSIAEALVSIAYQIENP